MTLAYRFMFKSTPFIKFYGISPIRHINDRSNCVKEHMTCMPWFSNSGTSYPIRTVINSIGQ